MSMLVMMTKMTVKVLIEKPTSAGIMAISH